MPDEEPLDLENDLNERVITDPSQFLTGTEDQGTTEVTGGDDSEPSEEEGATQAEEQTGGEDSAGDSVVVELPDDLAEIVGDSKVDRDTLKEWYRDHTNKEEWQKKNTQKAQELSALEEWRKFEEFIMQDPDRLDFFQDTVEKLRTGDFREEDKVEVPDLSVPDDLPEDYRGFFEGIKETANTLKQQLEKERKRNRRLRQQMQSQPPAAQNQQALNQPNGNQAAEELEAFLEEHPEIAEDQDKVNRLTQGVIESPGDTYEDVYRKLFFDEAVQKAKKSAEEKVRKQFEANNVVAEEEKPAETEVDQSGSVESLIQKNQSRSEASRGKLATFADRLKDAIRG